MEEDSYHTIAAAAESVLRERGSRFLAYAWPVEDEPSIREHIEQLRKRYYDATHHCYAWRLGAAGEESRSNDDGEPSGTAGKPILGQMLSSGITNALIVVVRYFGGTKLGTPGLIAAYRESAREVIGRCEIVQRTVDVVLELGFPYVAINDVMKVVRESAAAIISQHFDNVCSMKLSIRQGRAEELRGRLEKIEGIDIEPKKQ